MNERCCRNNERKALREGRYTNGVARIKHKRAMRSPSPIAFPNMGIVAKIIPMIMPGLLLPTADGNACGCSDNENNNIKMGLLRSQTTMSSFEQRIATFLIHNVHYSIFNLAISYTVGFRQSKTALFDWTFYRLDSSGPIFIVSRVDFIVFPRFLEAVGVGEHCPMAVESRLAALCFARFSRATHASRATKLRPSGLVALGLAESRQSYVRGVALSREPPKLQQA